MCKGYSERLSTHAYVRAGSGIYFSALNYNALYSYDLEKEELSYICSFPDERIDIRHLHCAAVRAGEKLYFIPMNGSRIHIFDLKTDLVSSVDLGRYAAVNVPSKFNKAFVDGDRIILVPGRSHYLIVLDTLTDTVTASDEWFQKCGLGDDFTDMICKYAAFIKDRTLYMISCLRGGLVKISLEDYGAELIRLEGNERGYLDAVYDEEAKAVWLLENGSNGILKLDLRTDLTERYEFADKSETVGWEYPYMSLLDMGDDLYILSYQAKRTKKFNKTEKSSADVSWEKEQPDDLEKEWNAQHYHVWKLDRDRFIVSNTGDLSFQMICKDKQEKEIYFEDKNWKKRIMVAKRQFLMENDTFGLSDFLGGVGSMTWNV